MTDQRTEFEAIKEKVAYFQTVLAQENRSVTELVGMGIQSGPICTTLITLVESERAARLKAEAERDEVREALIHHNDRLRSAIEVANREGQETNWKAFRGELHYTAAEYHETVTRARRLARAVGEDGHASDCATHNMPAMPAGDCDCKE